MLPILAAEPRVAAAWLFGSAAREALRADSDVDVAVLLDRNLDDSERTGLLAELASRLEAATQPRPLDLIVLEQQGWVFIHRVLSEGRRIVVHDEERRVDFESDAFVRYLDWKPTWDLAANEQIAGMRRWLKDYIAR
ncbi:MAG: nucleotidyltransferase domain-containing protein [Planctomycetes bacterium]|nr:nucleotidyltransferase domain-containing protein [Planctomycetota bacterium]